MEHSAPPAEPLVDNLYAPANPASAIPPAAPLQATAVSDSQAESGLRWLTSWPPLRAVAISAVLPNLVLSLAAAAAHTPRALVNLDYFVLAALQAYLTRTVMVVLFTVALLVDITLTFASAFHFGPAEVVAAVEQIANLSGRAIGLTIAFVGLIALFALALVRLRASATTRGWALPTLCIACVAAGYGGDVINGSNEMGWRPRTLLPVDVASSVALSQTHGTIDVPMQGPMAAATDPLREALADSVSGLRGAPPKIVMVLVESMGFPHGASMSSVFAPFLTDSIEERYHIRTGVVPFFGATADGELRELCGRRMNYKTALEGKLESCLPNRLKAAGYETISLHGYDGWFYQRRDWYPTIGFDRIIFREELQADDPLSECGLLFRGICDSNFKSLIQQELTDDTQRREFIYWVTLDTHFPLDPRRTPPDGACTTLGAVGGERSVCAVWTMLWPVMQDVAALASDPSIPPAWYIIVGDHSPPALTSDPHFYHQDRVPFIELRPRDHVLRVSDSNGK
jgi:hypothetical protein